MDNGDASNNNDNNGANNNNNFNFGGGTFVFNGVEGLNAQENAQIVNAFSAMLNNIMGATQHIHDHWHDHAHDNDEGGGDDDLPPDDDEMPVLEPIAPPTEPRLQPNNNMPPSPDDEMPPLEPVTSPHYPTSAANTAAGVTITAAPAAPEDDDDDDDSMPGLQTASESEDDEDDDNDSLSGDRDQDEVMRDAQPSAEHRHDHNNRRRGRADDDEDAVRDRRHPSVRVAAASNNSRININNTPPQPVLPSRNIRRQLTDLSLWQAPANPNPPFPRRAPGIPDPMGFALGMLNEEAFQNMNGLAFEVGPDGAMDPLDAFPAFPPNPNTNAANANPTANNANNNNNNQIPPNPFTTLPDGAPANFATFQNFLLALGGQMQNIFGPGFGEPEREDPQRARVLIAGLERVPSGLVKRMERVGGAPGAHVQGENGEDVPGCAVCWDTLLDAQGEGFGVKSEGEKNTENEGVPPVEPAQGAQGAPITEGTNGNTSIDEGVPSTSNTDVPPEPDPTDVVVLPCAHVFHAACLLPWFSRPRQTTCPTCRFNIDPESLTYRPPSRPTPAPRPTTQPTGAQGAPVPVPTPAPVPPPASTAAAAAAAVPLQNPPPPPPHLIPNVTVIPGLGPISATATLIRPQPAPPTHIIPDASAALAQAEPQPQVQAVPAPVEPPNVAAGGPPGAPGPTPALLFGGAAGVAGVGIGAQMAPWHAFFGQSLERMRQARQALETGPTQPNQGAANQTPQPQATPAQSQAAPANPPGQGQGAPPRFVDLNINIVIGAGGPQIQGADGAVGNVQITASANLRNGLNQDLEMADAPQPQAPMPTQPQPQPPLQPQAQGPPLGPLDAFRALFEGRAAQELQNNFAAAVRRGQNTADQIHGRERPANQQAGPIPNLGPGPMPGLPPDMFNPFLGRRANTSARPRERKPWTLPPAPGLTLRQRVETREREEGIRCDDPSCGLGPSDEEPTPTEPMQDQVSLGCDHKFHPSCLVTAERVSGWDGAAKEGGSAVRVPCPGCRVQGSISRAKWNEGVRANA